jgi:hypothetical protein
VKRFQTYSEMSVLDGTFRICCDARNDSFSIQYLKSGVYVTLLMSLEQAESVGREMIRLSDEGKVIYREAEYKKANPPTYDPALPENAVKLD